jgi:penicillin-binding protein 2
VNRPTIRPQVRPRIRPQVRSVPRAGRTSGPSTERHTRLRLVVIQALALALFATLLSRLYYVQVLGGEEYRARAVSQSIREVVVQPERGLIVDAMGRPLVANRTAWVVAIDRTVLARMAPADRDALLDRVAEVVEIRPGLVRARLLDCGDSDARTGRCWNGEPYQPVPVATDVPQATALRILEQPEDYPAVVVERGSVRAFPSPYGTNAAHLLGYLSPVTADELEAAQQDRDRSVNGASVVGRAGIEKEYDAWLRGTPGYRRVAVDSMGRVLGTGDEILSRPGSTLVTSLDARVQGLVERQLAQTIRTARETRDEVTGRNYVADSGAAVVMEAKTGRIVAMASQPTYDPQLWVGGVGQEELDTLYSERAGTPLLSRATQGQFAPGSTWKPFMAAGALTNGYDPSTLLNCSSGLQVGNRTFRNYESGAYGYIDFAKALEVSCNTFFYRVGYDYWRRFGSDVAEVKAKDPLVAEAKSFGFGSKTGVDLPEEASGRIADRRWKRAYFRARKDYYCKVARRPVDPQKAGSAYTRLFAKEFCAEGYAYRAGDAVNFAIGQGDTVVTPLQLARGYAALANGGTLYAPRVGKAVVDERGRVLKEISPVKQGRVPVPKDTLGYIDAALQGVTRQGTMAWRMTGFPLEEVTIRSKTGSAEVYGKQSTSWVASYSEDYVVVMMVSQGGTGSGTSGPAIRKIWEALYGVRGDQVDSTRTLIPNVVAPAELPTFQADGSILPPVGEASSGIRGSAPGQGGDDG